MEILKQLEAIENEYKNVKYDFGNSNLINKLNELVIKYNKFYAKYEKKVDKKKQKDLFFKIKEIKKKVKGIEAEIEKIKVRMENKFDVVVLVGPNDLDIVHKQLTYTKKNIIGYRNIYLVSCDKDLQIEKTITIDEKSFPFKLENIRDFVVKNNKRRTINRKKWYFQQLLKLYSGNVIKGIRNKYLVVDCDTFFLKPTTFFEGEIPLYAYGTENNDPYFEHMKNLYKNFTKVDPEKSGICHHMVFDRKYVNEIIRIVERTHKKPFYNAYIDCVPERVKSGAAEYEVYFNFMLKFHKDKIKLRQLNWVNTSNFDEDLGKDYDYISWHWTRRKR